MSADTHEYGGIFFPDRMTMKSNAVCGDEFSEGKRDWSSDPTCVRCRKALGLPPLPPSHDSRLSQGP